MNGSRCRDKRYRGMLLKEALVASATAGTDFSLASPSQSRLKEASIAASVCNNISPSKIIANDPMPPALTFDRVSHPFVSGRVVHRQRLESSESLFWYLGTYSAPAEETGRDLPS